MSWLPEPGKGDLESALARLIEKWLAEWIVEPVSIRVQSRTRAELKSLQWQGKSGCMVGSHADAEVWLGQSACNGEGDVNNPADREILRQMGSGLLEDLALFFANLVSGISAQNVASAQNTPTNQLFLAESIFAKWSLGLALSPAVLTAARKQVAGAGRRVACGLRRDALASLVVQMGCHVGNACLSAGEVAQLAVGDVIVLDRQPGVALALAIEGNACASGKAKVLRSVEGASITIAERPSLLRKVGNFGDPKFGE